MSANSRLTSDSFVGLVRQSGLVDHEALKRVLKELQESPALGDSPDAVADQLIERKLLTRWQADKLLQGKHKGFFLGKYRLLSHLGSGGMSAVYLAEHVLMRRRVAIKVLPQSRIGDSSYLQRFHREAQAVAALDHRNIVRAYDVDQEGKNHFLVMEYVPGLSLHELVQRHGPVDFVAAAEYIRQAADGLHHAHRMGMVHRDIKPGNLLIDEKGTVKLLDLGLARFFDEKEEASLTIQHDEKVLGTADYLSPEQALDSHAVDIRSDIYSLGCTLYYLLTAHPPFPDGTLAQRLLAHQTRQPTAVAKDRPDIPTSLVLLLSRMMAKKPEDRFQSARDASQALLEWLAQNGGANWSKMNPFIGGSGAYAPNVPAAPSGGSSSNVLSGGEPVPDVSAGPLSPVGDSQVSVGAALPAQTESADLAGFLSELSGQDNGAAAKLPAAPAASELAPAPSAPRAHSGSGTHDIVRDPAVEPQPRRSQGISAGQPRTTPSRATPAATRQKEPSAEVKPALSIGGTESPAPISDAAADESPFPSFFDHDDAPQKTASRPVAGSARSASATSPLRSKGVLLGGGAACLLLIGIAAFLLFGGNSPQKAGPDSKSGSEVAKNGSEGDGGKKKPVVEADPVKPRALFPVGPEAEFKTIGAALAEVKKQVSRSRRSTFTVRVAAGQTYAERIVLDGSYPRGVQIIAEKGAPPVLAPADSEPIIVLDGAASGELQQVQIEGFQLEAAGKTAAVRVTGWVPGLKLKDLRIQGFGESGVHLDGALSYAAEEDRIVLDSLWFPGGAAGGTGIRFSRQSEDPRHIRLQQCRFVAPLATGVRFDSGAIDIEIVESIFHQTPVGIHLTGEKQDWRDLLFAFNTFYENERGIVFEQMPAPGSLGFGFFNNLFVNDKTADVVIEKDYDSKQFLSMYRTSPGGSAHNWTTRARPETPPAGELTMLFETPGGRFATTELPFQSLDPLTPEFLAPLPNAPQKQPGSLLPSKRFGKQVGARR